MRLGVFTPLLSHLPLEDVLAKLKSLQIDAVELGTGNYPGDAHCKLSMLEDASALKEFQQKLKDHDMSISALSCHGNALHPQQALAEKAREGQPENHSAGGKAGCFHRMPRRLWKCDEMRTSGWWQIFS
jgi:sugar phosphate isomerase/epimerase